MTSLAVGSRFDVAQEFARINQCIFNSKIPEGLSEVILSAQVISHIDFQDKGWATVDALQSKIELARLNIIFGRILTQVNGVNYSTVYADLLREFEKPWQVSAEKTEEFIRQKGNFLIEQVSLMKPQDINLLKADFVPFPVGLSKQLLEFAYHFSWVRKRCSEGKDFADIAFDSFSKICRYEGNDWKLINKIITQPPIRNEILEKTAIALDKMGLSECAGKVRQEISSSADEL